MRGRVSELDKVEGKTELCGERGDRACEVGRLERINEGVDESVCGRVLA